MRPKTDQTKRRILDAAYELFWRSGFTRTNVDSIAERAHLDGRLEALMLIHSDRRYIDAAACAARQLIKQTSDTRRQTTLAHSS